MKTKIFLGFMLMLAGCATQTPPQGTTASGINPGTATTTTIDAAADEMRSSLGRGVARYPLSSGDRLEILFHLGTDPEPVEYVLGVGDRLRVDFYYHSEASRDVIVRPDGKITLPVKGDFEAAGLTPSELREAVHEAFSDFFNDPIITISVEEFARAHDLKETLSSAQRGRAKQVTVGPDGKIYLPFLPGLQAAGNTVDDLRDDINRRYSRRFGGLTVSVLLDEIQGNRTFVFGEVPKPGIAPSTQPQTVMQAVASVGGPLPTSALTRIKVLYWDSDNTAQVKTFNFKEIYEDPSKDIILPKNSTVYVPPSRITIADRFMDQYLRQLFLFNGISLGFSYELHAEDPNN